MEMDGLTICVVGETRENEAHTTMFAYWKEQKTGKQNLIGKRLWEKK